MNSIISRILIEHQDGATIEYIYEPQNFLKLFNSPPSEIEEGEIQIGDNINVNGSAYRIKNILTSMRREPVSQEILDIGEIDLYSNDVPRPYQMTLILMVE